MRIYFDIETIPGQQPEARELAAVSVKPPGILKKAESIAAWWDTESAAAIEEAYRKQALDAAEGEIIAIAWATDASEVQCHLRKMGENEADLLRDFFAAVQHAMHEEGVTGTDGRMLPLDNPFLIAHNATFDLGFVWRRCLVNGVRPPFKFPPPNARQGNDYGCTMVAWAGFGKTISLDRLCRALRVDSPKGDMDGSKVFDAWLAGEHDRIAEYNCADVVAVRAIWRRLNWEKQA